MREDTSRSHGERCTREVHPKFRSRINAAIYWKENISLIIKCLVIWFVVSYGFVIILVDSLNTIRLGGYKLGFWFSQQGSIYIFVILIFTILLKWVRLIRNMVQIMIRINKL